MTLQAVRSGHINLTILIDDVDALRGGRTVVEMRDLLASGRPSHLHALGLELGDEDDRTV